MIVIFISISIILFMRFGPDIPIRRTLLHHLAERPAKALLKFKRYQLVFLLIAPALLLFSGEIIMIFGPEFMLAYAADVALYIDIIAVSAMTSSINYVRDVIQRRQQPESAISLVSRHRGRRARRAFRKSVSIKGANDDDDCGANLGWREWHQIAIAA